MKRATLTDTQNNLSALVDQVQQLSRASIPLSREVLMATPPRPSEGASALEALLAERRDGR